MLSVTVEASDFKFGVLLGFDRAYRKITPAGKTRSGTAIGELRRIWGFPLFFSARTEARCFIFGKQLGVTRSQHKIIPRGTTASGSRSRLHCELIGIG